MIVAAIFLSFAALSVTALSDGFEKAIEGFSAQHYNVISLKVGQMHSPLASTWVMGGGEGFTSDPSVVTIDSDGVVTAVGEGSAYIYIVAVTGMDDIYYYTVEAAKDTATLPDEDREEVKDTQNSTQDTQKAPYVDGEDENDDEERNEPFFPSAGQNDENGHDDGESRDDAYNDFQKDYNKTKSFVLIMQKVVICLVAAVLCIVIYSLITMAMLSVSSMKKKELPPRVQNGNTITALIPDAKFCPKCNTEFGNASFCPNCGSPKKQKAVFNVPIKRCMTAQKFEKYINAWLAENPYITDCKFRIENRSSLFSPFVQLKFFVTKASVEYSVSPTPVPHRYGFAFLYKFRVFGPIGYSEEKHVARWNENNPDCSVLYTKGGRIQHFGDHGFYAQYYNYVFFKK